MQGRDTPEDAARTVGASLRTTQRKLPHWTMGGATYFVTFRLFGRPGGPQRLSAWERAMIGEAIRFWHPAQWHIHCYTVMPDHVHLLATPQEIRPGQWAALSRLLHSVKSYTLSQYT